MAPIERKTVKHRNQGRKEADADKAKIGDAEA